MDNNHFGDARNHAIGEELRRFNELPLELRENLLRELGLARHPAEQPVFADDANLAADADQAAIESEPKSEVTALYYVGNLTYVSVKTTTDLVKSIAEIAPGRGKRLLNGLIGRKVVVGIADISYLPGPDGQEVIHVGNVTPDKLLKKFIKNTHAFDGMTEELSSGPYKDLVIDQPSDAPKKPHKAIVIGWRRSKAYDMALRFVPAIVDAVVEIILNSPH